ncbi:uncharacterized protein LOC134257262 [Saccostrea cucullata]|uniref:uncharacterized protein LOC134250241 n=1 Tax=Saccostrea cuccullata TaxID=36930 RepID=UPI002ED4DE91
MATPEVSTVKAQDIRRCQLCLGKHRKAAAEIICKNCHVNLCKDCVGPHMVSNPNVKHEVLTFELTKFDIIPPQCSRHHEQLCDTFCQTCGSPICHKCSSLGFHDNHNLQHISDIYSSRKKIIYEDKNELETYVAPVYETIIIEIDSMLSNVVQKHGERQQGITEFGERCHNLLDKVIKRYLEESKDVARGDTEFLSALKSEFQSRQTLIQSAINENESVLSSKDSSKLIYYNSKNEYFRNVPARYNLTVLQFNLNELTEQKICELIGVLPRSIKTDIPARVLKTVQHLPIRKFAAKPKVIKTVNTGYGETYRVNCIPNTNQFYVWGNTAFTKLMNTDENTLEEIPTSELSDQAVTKEGYLVYAERKTKCIKIRKSNEIECLTSTQEWTPLGICSCSTGEFLVSMKSLERKDSPSKVVRFSGSTVKQEIQYDAVGKALYAKPLCIEENKNLDIIVSDDDFNKVVVVHKTGKLRFIYDGNPKSKRYEIFTPSGVTTTSMCHILIADRINHIIHIIDENGHFTLHIANNEFQDPYDLSTDSNDNLFVAERVSGKVKLIKLFE